MKYIYGVAVKKKKKKHIRSGTLFNNAHAAQLNYMKVLKVIINEK